MIYFDEKDKSCYDPIIFNATLSEEIKRRQKAWMRDTDNNKRVSFMDLAAYLKSMDLEDYFQDVLDNIQGPMFDPCIAPDLHINISDWSVIDVSDWICSLNFVFHPWPRPFRAPSTAEFVGKTRECVAKTIQDELIDGKTYVHMNNHQMYCIGLSAEAIVLLNCIKKGWRKGWTKVYECQSNVSRDAKKTFAHCQSVVLSPTQDNDCNTDPLAILSDTSQAVSSSYGSLTVIGYKELRLEGSGLEPMGASNDTFVLKKRKNSNGVKISNTAFLNRKEAKRPNIIFKVAADPTKDKFQIGRSDCNSTNDFITRGPLKLSKNGYPCSPVSKEACHIECLRAPPYDCHLYASGTTAAGDLQLGDNALAIYDANGNITDALTTYGAILWSPVIKEWCEVSVRGHCYSIRSNIRQPGKRLCEPFTNALVPGCIIDICGVTLLFTKPNDSAKKVSPEEIMDSFNRVKPQCPVLMSNLKFSYMSSQSRKLDAIESLVAEGKSFAPFGNVAVPSHNYNHIDEESRTFVFPACGHVHGYHKSLEGKSCPLCRTPGSFVPLVLPIVPSICDKLPTYVFNPCGHAISQTSAEYWANLPLLVYDINTVQPFLMKRSCCPFCKTILQTGRPSTKLILQCEDGKSIDGDCANI